MEFKWSKAIQTFEENYVNKSIYSLLSLKYTFDNNISRKPKN